MCTGTSHKGLEPYKQTVPVQHLKHTVSVRPEQAKKAALTCVMRAERARSAKQAKIGHHGTASLSESLGRGRRRGKPASARNGRASSRLPGADRRGGRFGGDRAGQGAADQREQLGQRGWRSSQRTCHVDSAVSSHMGNGLVRLVRGDLQVKSPTHRLGVRRRRAHRT